MLTINSEPDADTPPAVRPCWRKECSNTSMLKPAEVAAWVGAITGPSALMWDLYKWKTSGPRLSLTVSTDMMMLPRVDDATYVSASVRNTGRASTTITGLGFAVYEGWLARARLAPSAQFVIPSPVSGQRLPFKLDVGAEWNGMAIQDSELEKLMITGKLWCRVYHSWSNRPVQVRVSRKRL